MDKRLQSIITVLATFGILELVSLLKINIVLGAKTALFSGFSVGGPLVGMYAGMGFGVGLFALRRILHSIFMGTSLFSLFSLYLPTVAASYYFKSSSWLIRLAVPLACMVLFMIHPVGAQAWFYSFYWLVPVALYVLPTRSSFTEALGATFVQHAVGSVIWLYVMPTTVALWVALMPIVIVERLLCAVGMVTMMQLVAFVRSINTQRIPVLKQLSAKI